MGISCKHQDHTIWCPWLPTTPPGAPACLPHSRSQLAQCTTSVPSPELSTRNCSSRSTGGSPLGPFTTVWCLRRSCSQDPHAPSPWLPTSIPTATFQAETKNREGGWGAEGLASAINTSASVSPTLSLPRPSPGQTLGGYGVSKAPLQSLSLHWANLDPHTPRNLSQHNLRLQLPHPTPYK